MTTQEIIEVIKGLSVLELNDLVKACEEEFGVSAAAGVVVAAADGAAAAGNACAGRDNDIGYRKVRRNVRGSIADPVPVPVYPEVPGKRRYAWRNQRVTKAAGAA